MEGRTSSPKILPCRLAALDGDCTRTFSYNIFYLWKLTRLEQLDLKGREGMWRFKMALKKLYFTVAVMDGAPPDPPSADDRLARCPNKTLFDPKQKRPQIRQADKLADWLWLHFAATAEHITLSDPCKNFTTAFQVALSNYSEQATHFSSQDCSQCRNTSLQQQWSSRRDLTAMAEATAPVKVLDTYVITENTTADL